MIVHFNGKHTAFMQLIALQLVRLSRLLQVQIAVVTAGKDCDQSSKCSQVIESKSACAARAVAFLTKLQRFGD